MNLIDKSFSDCNIDCKNDIQRIRLKNPNRLIVAQININSLRNKFDFLVPIFYNSIDILLMTETKIDDSFPNAQFYIAGYTIYRRDRNVNGGGLLLYVREDIPSSILIIDPIYESLFIEINVRKKKWVIGCTYNPKHNLIESHLEQVGKHLDSYLTTYDNFLIIGDMNAEPQNEYVLDFCQAYNCKNLIYEKTCFKNHENPSCIDLMITNVPKSFQGSVAIETGLSDFHKLTLSIMKVFYKKQKPIIINYRDYRNFDNDAFMNDVKEKVSQFNHEDRFNKFDLFKGTVFRIFDDHAKLKKKYVRANQAPFINKRVKKEIMKRSRLRNKFFKTKNEIDRLNYNKQRNFCLSLIRNEKKKYFSNINTGDITDSKKFWKTVKPLFTEKISIKPKITLIEKNNTSQEGQDDLVIENVISDDIGVSEVFNEYFVNIVPNLKITELIIDENFTETADKLSDSINKFKNHPSIIMIKTKNNSPDTFSFSKTTYDNVLQKIDSLDVTKASQQTDISTKILKQNSEYFANYFFENINFCIENSEFPSDLKLADVIPIYKKNSRNLKDNYRPVSILSNISKVYERTIYEQLQSHFENIFSKFQCGFRKGYNAQHCLVVLIEKWKKSVDNGGAFGALFTDLSKAFDCLSHELLIAKLDAYGLDKKSLRLVNNYLSNRNQRVKINNSFSSWGKILFGVPQGSILGPLLFNIFICDMFYFLEDYNIANYADDSTPYSAKDNNELVIIDLEKSSAILFKWLKENSMKANSDKSHLLMSVNKTNVAKIDGHCIESEDEQELLGILIDSNLTFENHINNLCKKASQKLNALARISTYMTIDKRRILMKSFIMSQFGYCPLIWMFHSRALNNKINAIHKRALRITYNDKISTFQQLLEKDNSVSIHQRNLQVLATEMFKIYKELSPELMNDIFIQNVPFYNLRNNNPFKSRKVRSVYHGTESLSFLGPKIWDQVPLEIKESGNIETFKH